MKRRARPLGTLGERLKAARLAAGLKAKELDDRAGTTKGHVSLIESGTRPNVEAKTASKLASALGISLDWLINGEGSTDAEAALAARNHVGSTGSAA